MSTGRKSRLVVSEDDSAKTPGSMPHSDVVPLKAPEFIRENAGGLVNGFACLYATLMTTG
jgi:hypothetical protein